jgi:hypothetical protein
MDLYTYENTSDTLKDALAGYLGGIIIDWEKNAADAVSRLEMKPYHLLIVDLYIPGDEDEAVDESAMGGLAMLKGLKGKGIPSVLVVPAKTNNLQAEVDGLQNCRMVPKGSRYAEELGKVSRLIMIDFQDQRGVSKIEKAGTIDVDLDLHRNLYQFEISGEFGDSSYLDRGMLVIHPEEMAKLASRSRLVQVDNWEEELTNIGETLCKEILENNIKFMKSFYKVLGKIDKSDKIRVRFSVDKEVHPVLLEAMIEDNAFIMLSSPVYRKLSVQGEYHAAFNQLGKDRPPINCLIIESDFQGRVPKIAPGLNFPRLSNIGREALSLHDTLNENREKFNIGDIKWVRVEPAHKSLLDHLKTLLNPQKNWELVHFAGHSFFDAKQGKGYLLFPKAGAADDDRADVVQLKHFSQWLRDCNTQLLFLSSCHSSGEDFVFELAANRIPSIIGFRWDIDDDMALACAEKFYTHLFKEGQTLAYAFFETRRDMHRAHPDNRVWAAPMLIMQES